MDKMPIEMSVSTATIAKYIDANFKTDTDKSRAIFYWITASIAYDYENRLTLDFNQTSQEKIINTLNTRKGVCIHYAEVFNDIAKKAGIKAFIIHGYTKQNGKIGTISHAWCAAKTDNKWWLFDPTWGAGYIEKEKFYKKRNDFYFKVEPSKLIENHIPYDYLWQFLNYPITNQEFLKGKTQIIKTKPYFDFNLEIKKYEDLSDINKAIESAKRIEKNGVNNNLIRETLVYKQKEFEMYRNSIAVEKLNKIGDDFNEAVAAFNDFIFYRNKQFTPILPDEDIRTMIQKPKHKFDDCLDRIYHLGPVNENNKESVNSLKNSILDLIKQTEVQENFVKEYLSKSKGARKSMFVKKTLFGMQIH